METGDFEFQILHVFLMFHQRDFTRLVETMFNDFTILRISQYRRIAKQFNSLTVKWRRRLKGLRCSDFGNSCANRGSDLIDLGENEGC